MWCGNGVFAQIKNKIPQRLALGQTLEPVEGEYHQNQAAYVYLRVLFVAFHLVIEVSFRKRRVTGLRKTYTTNTAVDSISMKSQ